MDPAGAIRIFLDEVGLRLRRRTALLATSYLIALWVGLLFLAPLVAYLASLGHQTGWGVLAVGVLGSWIGLAGILIVPSRRWKGRRVAALYVGEEVETLRSDLLSSLELMEASSTSGSQELTEALWFDTANRLEPLKPKMIVSRAPLKRPWQIVLGLVVLYVGAQLAAPAAMAEGWSRLTTVPAPAPFDGAMMAQEPLVGDVDIIVEFPEYTGRQPLQLPSSSGDFEAMPGSTIGISTSPLDAIETAALLLSPTSELSADEALPLHEQDGRLEASFVVTQDTYYRFEVETGTERKVEARARHIHLQADATPTIELYAPADELDVAKIKRIELAYVAADDFGIAKVELVYKEAGGKELRELLPLSPRDMEGSTLRQAQAKHLWDLATLPLRPGVQIEYHVEVTDNDDVLGPNIGRSKSFRLRLFSPRERHEELIERQQELVEHMIELLASRLTATRTHLRAHQEIHRMASDIIVEMGSLAAALKSDELAAGKLAMTLDGLRDRMDKRVRTEGALLQDLEQRARKAGGELAIGELERMGKSDDKIVAELEDDVLTLVDWIQRQEMENLLNISDEIKANQERLKQLFEEYERTGSPEVLAEIQRELRALEKKLAEMSQKSAQVPEDVLDRFVNSEALQQQQDTDCLSKVQELLDAGDVVAAQKQMAKCSEEMDMGAKALEDALSSLRKDSFSEEEKLFNEMMSEAADLGQDQAEIADATEDIYKRYAEEVSKLKDDKSSEAKAQVGETLKKLRKKLEQIPRDGLTAFSKEEFDILQNRLDETEKMLKRGDLAEALSMARYANRALRTVQDEQQASLDDAWSRKGQVAERAARKAMPLSQQLVDELADATPSPYEIMSKSDKQNLEKLRRRQKSVRQRSEKLRKKLAGQEKLPGKAGDAMQDGLKAAMENMQRAEKQMKNRDPSGARQDTREAAKQLQEAQKQAQGAARLKQKSGQTGWRDKPIRIPGADEYKAPEKFREEILDAMEDGSAPNGFADQVKQYYKDIIQ